MGGGVGGGGHLMYSGLYGKLVTGPSIVVSILIFDTSYNLLPVTTEHYLFACVLVCGIYSSNTKVTLLA